MFGIASLHLPQCTTYIGNITCFSMKGPQVMHYPIHSRPNEYRSYFIWNFPVPLQWVTIGSRVEENMPCGCFFLWMTGAFLFFSGHVDELCDWVSIFEESEAIEWQHASNWTSIAKGQATLSLLVGRQLLSLPSLLIGHRWDRVRCGSGHLIKTTLSTRDESASLCWCRLAGSLGTLVEQFLRT